MISDIHGCYQEYMELLQKISFSDEDELYVLGDAMDRGPDPIKVIQDLMARPNAFYILGNHDLMLLRVMRKMVVELTEDNYEYHLTADDLMAYADWMRNGGGVTAEQFRRLPREVQQDILGYLEESFAYEMLEYEGKLYVLVHAGLGNFRPDKELDEYDLSDLVWRRADYGRTYFPGGRIFLVTGHTPTTRIHPDRKPLVYEGNGHIAIDCGCVFGGNLAAYCIETGETGYVKAKEGAYDKLAN